MQLNFSSRLNESETEICSDLEPTTADRPRSFRFSRPPITVIELISIIHCSGLKGRVAEEITHYLPSYAEGYSCTHAMYYGIGRVLANIIIISYYPCRKASKFVSLDLSLFTLLYVPWCTV